MGRTIDAGWVPEDDPMFSGEWMMFSVRKPSPAPEAEYTPEEQKLIDLLERLEGRKLTQQEINLSLDQARNLGEL
jgi:hypothetical protein